MSEVVHYRGRLQKIERKDDETLEDLCKRIVDRSTTYYESWEEHIRCERYKEYVVCNGELYKILSQDELYPDSTFTIRECTNGEYEYDVIFYNGGWCLEEAIEEAFRNLDND